MKKLVRKATKALFGATVYANHTAIKGKKSSGKEDNFSNDKNWKSLSNDTSRL